MAKNTTLRQCVMDEIKYRIDVNNNGYFHTYQHKIPYELRAGIQIKEGDFDATVYYYGKPVFKYQRVYSERAIRGEHPEKLPKLIAI